jgi:hypothetical protein
MPLLTELENLFFVWFYKDIAPTALAYDLNDSRASAGIFFLFE